MSVHISLTDHSKNWVFTGKHILLLFDAVGKRQHLFKENGKVLRCSSSDDVDDFGGLKCCETILKKSVRCAIQNYH